MEGSSIKRWSLFGHGLSGNDQCSQRGSPSVLRVGRGRTTICSPSGPGENFARG